MSKRTVCTTIQSPRDECKKQRTDSIKWKIFCDLDGVLSDFDKAVRTIFDGQGPSDLPKKQMWNTLARHGGGKFFWPTENCEKGYVF